MKEQTKIITEHCNRPKGSDLIGMAIEYILRDSQLGLTLLVKIKKKKIEGTK